ncbi:MAG TPA: helix-turn-helix domain-containing protein, partial [bacterium]|nr:helix-turn-helix domain-containing protein [bacterium]
FMAYDWPGNIRELQNTLATAVLFAEDVDGVHAITVRSLAFKPQLWEGKKTSESPVKLQSAEMADPVLAETLSALRDNCYHRGRAAQALGISRRTLYARLRRFGISTDLVSIKEQIDRYL